jgi:alcohol dehydrogenase class IV
LRHFAAFRNPPESVGSAISKTITIPQVAVNTSSGTGADCTSATIVNDTEWVYKLIVSVPSVLPSVGISDPALMRLQPPEMIARTGMDAFCHGMEPFIGRIGLPVAHATGLRAIKLLSENICEAYANPANDVAIEKMAWAQLIASMSYNMGGGMGMVHGLAHMLSVIKDLHHGYTNAIMMMPVERFNVVACPERFKEIGEAMGLDIHHMHPAHAADKTLTAIERLRNDVGIPQVPLGDFDFTEADIEHTIKFVLNDVSGENNPRDIGADQIRELLRACI